MALTLYSEYVRCMSTFLILLSIPIEKVPRLELTRPTSQANRSYRPYHTAPGCCLCKEQICLISCSLCLPSPMFFLVCVQSDVRYLREDTLRSPPRSMGRSVVISYIFMSFIVKRWPFCQWSSRPYCFVRRRFWNQDRVMFSGFPLDYAKPKTGSYPKA